MTKEEIQELSKWENNFHLAIKANFVRMSASEFGEFARVYNKHNTPLTPSQLNCNTCRLNALKTMGETYFSEKARIETEENKNDNNPEPTQKKMGRPRKIKTE